MAKVTLIRGKKPTRTWEHPTRGGAARRAWALADLHGAEVQETDEGFVVDASEYYGAKRRRKNAGKVISLAAFRKKGKIEEEEDEPEETREPTREEIREGGRQKRERGELWWQMGRPGGPSGPEDVAERVQSFKDAAKVKQRVMRILKVTQGAFSPTTVKSNLATVREYDDDLLRRLAFESTEKQWMEKPSFYRAVIQTAADRWAMFKPNPPKRNKRKSTKKKLDAKAILRRAMRGT